MLAIEHALSHIWQAERYICYSKCMLRNPARRMQNEQRRFSIDAILCVGIHMMNINMHLLERRVLNSDIICTPLHPLKCLGDARGDAHANKEDENKVYFGLSVREPSSPQGYPVLFPQGYTGQLVLP